MRKYKYAIIIIAVIGSILVCTIAVMFNLRLSNTNKNENSIEINENLYESAIGENAEKIKSVNNIEKVKISPGATIIFKKYYKKCDHTLFEKIKATNQMINLEEEEFKKLYNEWEILNFSSNEIILYKEFNQYCNEHYVVKENNRTN